MVKDIYQTITQEIEDFINNPVEIVDGHSFNQYETIKRNHLYYNSLFEDNSDYNGRDKIFDNIVSYGCIIESTLLDFDTKDSKLVALNPSSKEAEFFLDKELELYLKNNKLDNLYDDIVDELPVYGSVVLKYGKPIPTLVDLRRLFNDPTVSKITESRFIILKHYLTAQQLREKKDIWDADVIDKILKDSDKYCDTIEDSYQDSENQNLNTQSPYFVVYERYGEVPELYLKKNGKDDEYCRSVFVTTDPKRADGLTLFKQEWNKEYPFKDAHRRKTRGRWLGISAIEEKFPDQERTNELANQKRLAMEISSMQLYQTSDQTILKNVLKDKQTGDIIRKTLGGDGLTAIDTRVKNFTEFQAEEEKWKTHGDRMSFTPNILQGGDIPATMPATNAVLMNNNSTSVHTKRRERIAQMLREMFNDWILPDLKKSISKEHILKFSGSIDQIKQLDKMFKPVMRRDALMEQALSGKMMNPEEAEMGLEQMLADMPQTRFVKIIEKWYKDLDIEYDVIVDASQKNLQAALNNSLSVLNQLMAAPQALDDPRVKAVFYEWASLAGINPIKLEQADRERQTQVQQMQQQAPDKAQVAQGVGQPQAQDLVGQMQTRLAGLT